ncbi:glycosyltransferase family 4 protein [Rhodoferax sp. AJA081-3]|uniref:glycosyltransferase family 4 protein n=1 Tax=Rhodoferax sp. AJA081-3 TaxID=2752316 RepID=UPI001ADF30E2|nr:glycosyltransferase family 4 protein [Rhodoferax sp. AJA081-3]QTN26753.1 glycosyltransferase family 4 protein [Rhodoferax sp. AJA081-3]
MMSQSSIRIALFIPNFEAGGAERVTIRLAQGLVERGHDVDLLVLSDRGPYRKEVDSRIRIINLGASRALFGILPLIRYLRLRRPDALLSAIFHTNCVAVVAGWLSGTKTRVVLSEHNTLGLVKSAVNRFYWNVFLLALRTIYPRADAVVCVSAGVASGLAALMPRLQPRLLVIGNPVVTDEVLRMSMEPVHHPWLEPRHSKLVLAVGRLVPAKGFDLLIAAFAEIASDFPAKLVILGDGPERPSLQALIEHHRLGDRVCLYGFTDNPYAWMRQADLFVLSSLHEGLPGALIEAMACGCKVVSTDCPSGPSEILEHGRWGRLVPVADIPALAHAISEELLSEHNSNTRFRAHAYHLAQVIQQYEKVLMNPKKST